MRLLQLFGAIALILMADSAFAACNPLLDFEAQKLSSDEQVNFCSNFEDKLLLVVNTASHCGFSGQFKGLESLYKKYQGQGLEIVGFPSNDFFQEASDEAETAEVCYINYGVTFTMLAPSAVRGRDANPLFEQLAQLTGKKTELGFQQVPDQPGWRNGQTLRHPDQTTGQCAGTGHRPVPGTLSEHLASI